MPSSARPASIALLLAVALPAFAQAPAPAPVEKSAASDAEAKLAMALRSYSILDAELDRVKAANAQLTTEKAALEAKLAEVQAAVPLAAQVSGLREQLRQTQAQMAAYADENVLLKNKLAMGGTNNASTHLTPTPVATTPPPAAAAPAPTPKAETKRTHLIVSGDTLAKISQQYYGTPNRWADILAANRDNLRDEKSLVIGRTLTLP
jgi:nucleoid-associated protein YgaU